MAGVRDFTESDHTRIWELLNEIGAEVNRYQTIPMIESRLGGDTGLGSGDFYTPDWTDVSGYDTAAYGRDGRLFVVKTAGHYTLNFHASFAPNANGTRRLLIYLNPSSNTTPPSGGQAPSGNNVISEQFAAAGASGSFENTVTTSVDLKLAAGTKVGFYMQQTSGSTLNVKARQAGMSGTWLQIIKRGEA